MLKFIAGFIFGLVIASIGFAGVARIIEDGVDKVGVVAQQVDNGVVSAKRLAN